MNVKVIEVRRGRDGKLYPPRMPIPLEQRSQARVLAHVLRCGQGLSYRQIQLVMAEQHGVRRSLGIIFADLHGYTCEYCEKEPDDR